MMVVFPGQPLVIIDETLPAVGSVTDRWNKTFKILSKRPD